MEIEAFELFSAGVKALNRAANAIEALPTSNGIDDAFVGHDEHRIPINVVDGLVRIADAINNLAEAIREHD